MTDNNVVQFPNKGKLEEGEAFASEADKYDGQDLRQHFDHFLKTLDASVETFQELSVMEKYSLYTTLVQFTHTSLDSFIKLKEGK